MSRESFDFPSCNKSPTSKKKRWNIKQFHRFCIQPSGKQIFPSGLLKSSGFFYGDRSGRANLHAALAAEAFIIIHNLRFSVFHFKDVYGAGIGTFPFPVTFTLVYGYNIHGASSPPLVD